MVSEVIFFYYTGDVLMLNINFPVVMTGGRIQEIKGKKRFGQPNTETEKQHPQENLMVLSLFYQPLRQEVNGCA